MHGDGIDEVAREGDWDTAQVKFLPGKVVEKTARLMELKGSGR
jgi:hypothetical protein